MLFEKRTTITKRNHRFYGPTESYKMATTLNETSVDLHNVYGQLNSQNDEFNAIASGYLEGSGRLVIMDGFVTEMENKLEKLIYIHATQDPIF
jgi:hypothetical protein